MLFADAQVSYWGGLLYLRGSSVTFAGATASERVVIRNGYAAVSGGGIYATSEDHPSTGVTVRTTISLVSLD